MIVGNSLFGGVRMKLRTVATLGAATLVGFNALKHHREEEAHKHEHKTLFNPAHIALYSSLFAAGLAIWEIRKHHHVAAA